MIAVRHVVSDADDPAGIPAAYSDALAPGSYVAPSLLDTSAEPPESLARVRALDDAGVSPRPRTARGAASVPPEFLEPGMVPVENWRPEGEASPENVVGHFRAAVAFQPYTTV